MKFSIYLNRRVFVMIASIVYCIVLSKARNLKLCNNKFVALIIMTIYRRCDNETGHSVLYIDHVFNQGYHIFNDLLRQGLNILF